MAGRHTDRNPAGGTTELNAGNTRRRRQKKARLAAPVSAFVAAICLAGVLIAGLTRQKADTPALTSGRETSLRASWATASAEGKPQTPTAGGRSASAFESDPVWTAAVTTRTENTGTTPDTMENTPVPAGSVKLNVPFVSQWPELPTGCEITAASMLLQFYGYPADKYDMAWNYLDINAYFYYDEFGVYFGPDPNAFFIGDPETFGGYGCFAPVIVNTLNRYLKDRKSSLAAYDMTGCQYTDLLTFLKQGRPVIVWASGYMTDLFISDSWMLPSGELFTWPGNEHCLVLAGYDENGLWFNDPLMDHESYGILQYDAEAFQYVWGLLGRQTILIR